MHIVARIRVTMKLVLTIGSHAAMHDVGDLQSWC